MTSDATATSSGLLLQEASVVFTGKTVLYPMSLHLSERRIGILGRNGSGKTTLLRLLAGLIEPSAGQVRVAGLDPAKDRKAMLRQLGILFQNPDHQILFPTVEEELAFGLIQMGMPKPEAAALVQARLAAEGRAHWAKAAVSTLSQGQRHWLCLIAVLLMQPQTILLDEPLAGLDLPTQMRLARAFATLPQQLVTITHDPFTLTDADRVIWLDRGRIRADGSASAVLPQFSAEMARLGEADADADLAD
jgi:biotin transport system ATP-binding protein